MSPGNSTVNSQDSSQVNSQANFQVKYQFNSRFNPSDKPKSKVKSLRELALIMIYRNIRLVNHVGDLLYRTVRDILLRVEVAAQLRQIELNSPQLQGETTEVWVKLIEKNFPLESGNLAYRPRDPKNWYKVWEKYKREQDERLTASEKLLASQIAHIKAEEAAKTSKLVELSAIPSSKKGALKRPRGKAAAPLSSGSSSRTKVVNGATVMRKVRSEAKQIARIHGSLSRQNQAPPARSTVTKAPVAMVNDHKRATLPPLLPCPKEPVKIDKMLELDFAFDIDYEHRYLSEAALEKYGNRAVYISESEEDGDGDAAKPKQPASAAPKLAARPAPKVPTTSLQRKFGASKSAFKAPSAPSAPVIKTREPVSKTEESGTKKRARRYADEMPDLPKEANLTDREKAIRPKCPGEVMAIADIKAEGKEKARDRKAAADTARLEHKRKNPNIFATHPRKRVF